jgi:hypothetical protein
MMTALAFTSLGTHEMAERGTLYFVECDRDRERGSGFSDIIDHDVLIDGVARRVVAVEAYCVPIIRAGMNIGLLVQPQSAEQVGGETQSNGVQGGTAK